MDRDVIEVPVEYTGSDDGRKGEQAELGGDHGFGGVPLEGFIEVAVAEEQAKAIVNYSPATKWGWKRGKKNGPKLSDASDDQNDEERPEDGHLHNSPEQRG